MTISAFTSHIPSWDRGRVGQHCGRVFNMLTGADFSGVHRSGPEWCANQLAQDLGCSYKPCCSCATSCRPGSPPVAGVAGRQQKELRLCVCQHASAAELEPVIERFVAAGVTVNTAGAAVGSRRKFGGFGA